MAICWLPRLLPQISPKNGILQHVTCLGRSPTIEHLTAPHEMAHVARTYESRHLFDSQAGVFEKLFGSCQPTQGKVVRWRDPKFFFEEMSET